MIEPQGRSAGKAERVAEAGEEAAGGGCGGPIGDVATHPKPQGPAHQEQAFALPQQSGEGADGGCI